MKLAILSRGDGWHVQDLLRAARDLGHEARSLDFRTLHTESLAGYDSVLVRTMPAGSLEQIVFRMDLLHAAEAKGMRVINPPRALETCVDKYLTNVRLEAANLPIPKTIVAQTCDDAMQAFEALGCDVVVKPLFGSEGRGMVRITDVEVAWRTFQTLATVQNVIYVQQFIKHPGWDVRAFVIDDTVVAAMKRSNKLDWRTNVAQGGIAEPFELEAPETQLAIRAAEATGSEIAGVDLLLDEANQWHVIEVNAVPGWNAISTTCKIDIAKEIVSLADRDFRAMYDDLSGYVRIPELFAQTAREACLWEVSARKIGNVHPKADFHDTTYFDFLMSSTCFGHAGYTAGIGSICLGCVKQTKYIVGKNTNLGMILLLVPLMCASGLSRSLEPIRRQRILRDILEAHRDDEADKFYRAIRIAAPGGLGAAEHGDVNEQPSLPILEAMKLAADRDMIARQYTNNYADVFDYGVPALIEGFTKYGCVEAAIIHCHLAWLSAFPDSLIARKNGLAVAEDVQRRVQAMMALGGLATPEGRAAGVALDAYLRSDGNRLNPGTSADLVCACLFVALREGKLMLNAPFPWTVKDWL